MAETVGARSTVVVGTGGPEPALRAAARADATRRPACDVDVVTTTG